MEMSSADIERMRRILRHRLLNIVSGVKSANSMLATQLDDRLNPREREYFPLIQNECDQVTVIVNRMDDLFGPVPPPSPSSLESAIASTMTGLRHKFPLAELNLSFDVADPERPVCAGTLETILTEAVGNAFEISRKPIDIYLRHLGEACSVSVVDQGPEVADELCELAFEPFYSGRTRHLGIGLSIAKRTVEERGGSASFTTEPEGNVVEFILPYI